MNTFSVAQCVKLDHLLEQIMPAKCGDRVDQLLDDLLRRRP